MKVKTSVTLSEELLKAIDEVNGSTVSRSEFIETAAWSYIAHRHREDQTAKDLEILNRRAQDLNAEAEDVLAYQINL
jgi:metal-responsive CopG/Arc/MetJ family transcriptional regulator